MHWTARLVAPLAECSLDYGVALRAGVQPDHSVGAERECHHLGPKSASGADVDDPTSTVPLEQTPNELDCLGARERPAQVLRGPRLDVGTEERGGVPGPVASKAAISDFGCVPEDSLDLVQVREGTAVVVPLGQGLYLADCSNGSSGGFGLGNADDCRTMRAWPTVAEGWRCALRLRRVATGRDCISVSVAKQQMGISIGFAGVERVHGYTAVGFAPTNGDVLRH